MAYGLKYYKEIHDGNYYFRLEISENVYSGSSREIGELQGVLLEIQGDQDGIDTVVQKTSLRFTMVDTWDIADGSVKHGSWEEFYTPDSTKFKVQIKTMVVGRYSTWETRWSGYVTPDSWLEGLGYRNSITITARDNIGHLQDFNYEFVPVEGSDNMWKITDIIDYAMTMIEMPMDLVYNTDTDGAAVGIESGGVKLMDAYVHMEHFDGMDWLSILTEVLESLGLVLRYTDRNTVTVSNIRNMGLFGRSRNPSGSLTLISTGGTRSIDPPFRSIREEMRYDYNSDIDLDILSGIVLGTSSTQYHYEVDGIPLPGGGSFDAEGDEPGYYASLADGLRWESTTDKAAFLNPDACAGFVGWPDNTRDYIFILANTQEDMDAAYKFYVLNTAINLNFVFAPRPAGLTTANKISVRNDFRLYRVIYDIKFTSGETVQYWDGTGWSSAPSRRTKEFDADNGVENEFNVQLIDAGTDGYIQVIIHRIEYKMVAGSSLRGVYARLAYITVSANVTSVTSDTVTTNNDESFNVRYNFKPGIGPLSYPAGLIVPENYGNILFTKNLDGNVAAFGYMGQFGSSQTAPQIPFPAMLHMQILANHIYPSEVIEGSFVLPDEVYLRIDSFYDYKNVGLMLISGIIDLLHNRFDNARFREYTSFESAWGSSIPVTNQTSKSGERASSGGGGGGRSFSPGGGEVTAGAIQSALGYTPMSEAAVRTLIAALSYFELDSNDYVKLKDAYYMLYANGALASAGPEDESGDDPSGGSDVAWGREGTNSIPLTVNGVTKTLLLYSAYTALSTLISNLSDSLTALAARVTALEQSGGSTPDLTALTARVATLEENQYFEKDTTSVSGETLIKLKDAFSMLYANGAIASGGPNDEPTTTSS